MRLPQLSGLAIARKLEQPTSRSSGQFGPLGAGPGRGRSTSSRTAARMQNVGDRARGQRDLTVLAVPFYFVTMAAEHLWLRRRAAARGGGAGDYERRDTIASLSMGVGSLVVPLIMPKLLRPFTLDGDVGGRSSSAWQPVPRWSRPERIWSVVAWRWFLRASRMGSRRRRHPHRARDWGDDDSKTGEEHYPTSGRPAAASRLRRGRRRAASDGGVTTVVMGGVALATVWATHTEPERLWKRRCCPPSRSGPLALAVALPHGISSTTGIIGSCTRAGTCGLSTSCTIRASTTTYRPRCDSLWPMPSAPRFPMARFVCSAFPPGLIKMARDINLLYQYWIHTETIGHLGRSEVVLNTPSHHRVHHGSNQPYLDRNHGSILICGTGSSAPSSPRSTPSSTDSPITSRPSMSVASPPTSTSRCSAMWPGQRDGPSVSRTWSAGRGGPSSIAPACRDWMMDVTLCRRHVIRSHPRPGRRPPQPRSRSEQHRKPEPT